MNHILNRYLPFLMKSPLFCLFWTLFGQFLGTFPFRPVLMIPWLLNWIIFWIDSTEFFLNWIIFWIESWAKQYWIICWQNSNIELNQIGHRPPLLACLEKGSMLYDRHSFNLSTFKPTSSVTFLGWTSFYDTGRLFGPGQLFRYWVKLPPSRL